MTNVCAGEGGFEKESGREALFYFDTHRRLREPRARGMQSTATQFQWGIVALLSQWAECSRPRQPARAAVPLLRGEIEEERERERGRENRGQRVAL